MPKWDIYVTLGLRIKGKKERVRECGGIRAQKDPRWAQQNRYTCERITAMAVCTDLYKLDS